MTLSKMKFSASLGFLWLELPLPQAIRAAHKAGFDAVECHWPYDCDPALVKAALNETGLTMLGINTVRGETASRENGLAAVIGRESEAQIAIDQAIDYARKIGAKNVHVMAGNLGPSTEHATKDARATQVFIHNLRYACDQAKAHNIGILIEPLNRHDAPEYFLKTTDQAIHIIDQVAQPNLRLMFDCYHVQLNEGDITRSLSKCWNYIGHIQFASVPDRGTPDQGELCYRHVFSTLKKLGYAAPLGAEYNPKGDTEASLAWLSEMR